MNNRDIVDEAAHDLDGSKWPFNYEDSAELITEFIDYFRGANAVTKEALRQRFGNARYGRLVGYGSRMADQTVRTNNVENLRRGLAAVALEGMQIDYRESTMAMCLLYHSALMLGVNPEELFREAAGLGNDHACAFILRYLASGNKNLEAFSFKEGTDENGLFKYVVFK